MAAVRGPAPGFHRHPDHSIRIHKATGRWRALDGDRLLAESHNARILEESGYGAVVYFPGSDVRDEALAVSPSETSCPFKGRARYFRSVANPGGPDIAWSYPGTYEEVVDIEGFIAFYADRISLEHTKPEAPEDS